MVPKLQFSDNSIGNQNYLSKNVMPGFSFVLCTVGRVCQFQWLGVLSHTYPEMVLVLW